MRDTTSWHKRLVNNLGKEDFPVSVMSPTEFCRVELGLYFLARTLPGEPIGILQSVLSGYVHTPPELDAPIRRLRHRMGDVARRGYWRRLLNHYMRVPGEWRAFERTDDHARRVDLHTVFEQRPVANCSDRTDVYEQALRDDLEYAPARSLPLAEAGRWYSFPTATGRQVVRLPDVLPVGTPIAALAAPGARTRQPWTISFTKDLYTAAEDIDAKLVARPDIRNRNWVKRLKFDMRPSALDPAQPHLVDRPESFDIDGVIQVVGLMNSGKTTLADALTYNRVTRYGNRVCLVVGSVGDVFEKVSLLRTLGINAVPLIGRRTRAEHSARYWRTAVEESAVLVPTPDTPADPAAAYANSSCLLEPLRQGTGADWQPLAPDEFPCHGQLREEDVDEPRLHDCPLISVCPAQKAYREVAEAQVWVTTMQCLLASRAQPAQVSMRWFEAMQAHADLVIIDEADAMQQVLDSRFVQAEQLVGGDKGWSHRMVRLYNDAMDRQFMAPAADPEIRRWYEHLQTHEQAVFTLNRLALSDEGAQLRDLLGSAPFTAYSLLRQVSRALFGLPKRSDGPKPQSTDRRSRLSVR